MYGELPLHTVYFNIRTCSPEFDSVIRQFAGIKKNVQLNIRHYEPSQKDHFGYTLMACFLITDRPHRSFTISNSSFPPETALVQGLTSSSSHLLRRAHSGILKSVDRQIFA